MRERLLRWAARSLVAASGLVGVAGLARASGESIVQQVNPLLWVMMAISVGGAAITYGVLVYAIWRFRDPATRRRNYG